MREAVDGQRSNPKYDTMRKDRRNRLEGLAGYQASSRPDPPRRAPRLTKDGVAPGQGYAKKWEGPLGFDDVKRNEKKSNQMSQARDRVNAIRSQRAKGIRSRHERSRPLRQVGASRLSQSPRKLGAPTWQEPGPPPAPKARLTCQFTSSGRSQVMGKARSTTPRNSLDMRGAESSFKTNGRDVSTGRRALTLSRGGMNPELNPRGVHSLLPIVVNEESIKKQKRIKVRNQRNTPDPGRIFGAMTPDREVLAREEHNREASPRVNTRGKLGEGHLSDLHLRETIMNQNTKHNIDLLSGVFKSLDVDQSGLIDIVELQRGLDMLQLDSSKGSVETFMQRAREIDKDRGRKADQNQVRFDTFVDLVSQFARGSTLGNMRAAAIDAKHKNYLKRNSHMENVAHGVVDGGLSNLRPGHYTNTALFASGYSRFNREELFKPNNAEHERVENREKRVLDEETKQWISMSEADAKDPRPRISAEEIARAEAEKKNRLAKKQFENQKKIQKLRSQLMKSHGKSKEQQPYRLRGENRFRADARQRREAIDMEIADEKQRWAEAKKTLKIYESDLFHQKPAARKAKSRTPNVWNKLINPDGL